MIILDDNHISTEMMGPSNPWGNENLLVWLKNLLWFEANHCHNYQTERIQRENVNDFLMLKTWKLINVTNLIEGIPKRKCYDLLGVTEKS